MKKVIGISLASSKRDHKSKIIVNKKELLLERFGCDGDFRKARRMFLDLEGKVAAFGLGGIDFYLGIKRMHRISLAWELTKGLKTPVFDGSGIKDIIDVSSLNKLSKKIDFSKKKVFMVCACNRKGMANYFEEHAKEVIYGDFIFGLKLPLPVNNLKAGEILADIVLPIATRLPYSFLYPVSKNKSARHRIGEKYFEWADVIAGDFHYISRYAPKKLNDKIIITTTVTKQDTEILKRKGVSLIATTTPDIEGRSFGSNIIEALLYAGYGKSYKEHLEEMCFEPSVTEFK